VAESLASNRIKTWKSKEMNMKPAGKLAQLLYSGNSSQAKNQINMLLIAFTGSCDNKHHQLLPKNTRSLTCESILYRLYIARGTPWGPEMVEGG
jgi:hypothetical protein